MVQGTEMLTSIWSGTGDKGSSIMAKISSNSELIMISIMVSICLWFLIRFIQHRRLVNIYEIVKGGYVKSGGRYSICNDKTTNIEYLRPIFGNKRLPSFPSKFWQKTFSVPLLGIQRVLNIVKINSYTYKPILIDYINGTISIKDYSTLGFVYMEEYRDFVKKRKRADVAHLLSFIAPSIVIMATLGFLAYAIYTQSGINEIATQRIEQATAALIDYASRVRG